ncbi:MAG: hypothetical protein CO013_08510 [Syntrophobacterales bacterium CG_4_8_14_3_um_filter_58_8]|nr:MAG: hypothetical protein CO013_08510 [Syntrophobacterales bacterium CG_4_8_14_3_um_filter_58_8]
MSRFAQDFPPATAFFHALYNAVSAFNNCGYSLFSDSLISYRGDWIVNLTVMGLIVLGGIGFIIQHEVIAHFRGAQKRLSLHTKLVLLTTGGLILAEAVLFYLFEADHVLKGVSGPTQFLDSLFQSITPRTAGFNTVDIGRLTNPTVLVMIILMFIGASPGSTGGGIKTTSFALLPLMIWNRMQGQYHVKVFNRQIRGRSSAGRLPSSSRRPSRSAPAPKPVPHRGDRDSGHRLRQDQHDSRDGLRDQGRGCPRRGGQGEGHPADQVDFSGFLFACSFSLSISSRYCSAWALTRSISSRVFSNFSSCLCLSSLMRSSMASRPT